MNHELRGVWILIGVVINVRATLIARAFAGVECVGCRPSVGCFFIFVYRYGAVCDESAVGDGRHWLWL